MPAALEVQQLTIKRDNKLLCDHLTAQIAGGEIWGILGQNGCGKTTLLHTLAGLRSPNAGQIRLNQHLLTHYSRRKLAQQVGVLLQDTTDNFPQTVLTTIFSGRYPHIKYWQTAGSDDQASVDEALQAMDLQPLAQRTINELSGGEKRRVAIATLLAQTPQLYLLDEPTSHLDLHYQVKVLTHLQTLAERRQVAIVMVLHEPNLVSRYCSHVMLLFNGGKIMLGTKHDLLQTELLCQLYQQPLQSIDSPQGTLWLPR